MRQQDNRPVVIPLGPKLVLLAAWCVALVVAALIGQWIGWIRS